MFRFLLFLLFGFICTSCKQKTLFKEVSSSYSGIDFNNIINETDSINVLDFENVYNGGGVGIGDFNNDGLPDIYFTGNLVSNKLYLNKGNLKFEDITEKAGVSGDGKWSRGVSVIDINNDGLLDMYVCSYVHKEVAGRENLLYINQGVDKDGIPSFKESASEYGLNDTTYSAMAAFFDYDNDGDLDVYILVNEIIAGDYPNRFRPRMLNGEHPSTGRLYRNDWNEEKGHAYFTNVSDEAGITIEGYGHGVVITDINKDGWADIYVTNDYLSNNILYINNGNGTFTDKITSYLKHTSANAMGVDVIDINNDGLQDIIELDMNPEDNFRKKMMMNANSYQTYQNSDYFKYQYQYVRNTLQLNQGPRVNENDSIGDPVFSDIAFFSGVAETDWSWAPLVVDFDNDGFRDLIVTNGFPKDVTDHDFVSFRNEAFAVASKKQLLEQIPEVKIHNYGYRNKGDMTFENVTHAWGLTKPSFSNGAAYADLDGDGDIDVVINNINDKAFLYENTLANKKNKNANFLSVQLVGDSLNINGLGTWIEIYYQGLKQVYEQTPYRGYLSSVQLNPHFGLGDVNTIDSVVVKWPANKKQTIVNVPVNQKIVIDYKQANQHYEWSGGTLATNTLFTDVSSAYIDSFVHEELDYVDFNIQKLIPHKLSEYGPALAVGDVNGDGLDDVIVGGSVSFSTSILLQQPNGRFKKKLLISDANMFTKRSEDMGILLFDANKDGFLDLLVTSGGYENERNTIAFEDKLYLNDGKGNFTITEGALPQNFTSKSCVRAADFDKDGDLDLFIAGRVDPGNYPKPVSSFIYRNDSKDGVVKFTDVTASVAISLNNIGMVCDAIWTDFDNDGWQDLILAGEWMPVTFLKNNKGVFDDITSTTGIEKKNGWWTSIASGDFDNDGDIDYIIGNLGLNSFYRGSEKYPVRMYAKDFDNNSSYDAIPTLFLPTTLQNREMKEFPAHVRDDMTKQLISFRSKFQNYRSYSTATFSEMFSKEELEGAQILKSNYFSNSFLKNLGNGKFELHPLPMAVQYSCINGMVIDDFNKDGNLDVMINGNDFGTEVSVGRYDACNGLVLLGDGRGGFNTQSIIQSGLFIPGNGKSVVKLRSASGSTLIAASQNRGPLKLFNVNNSQPSIALNPDDETVIIYLNNNLAQRQDIQYGSSFLSQSARFLSVPGEAKRLTVINSKGEKREIPIPK
jgi:hypothetical protein